MIYADTYVYIPFDQEEEYFNEYYDLLYDTSSQDTDKAWYNIEK